MPTRAKLALGLALLMGLPVLAVGTKFSNVTPLSSSAGPLPIDGPEEATPITLPDSKWSQRTVADRRTQEDLLRGEDVALEEIDNDCWNIVYYTTLPARWDGCTRQLTSAYAGQGCKAGCWTL